MSDSNSGPQNVFGGSKDDYLHDIVQTSDGNYLACGSSESSDDAIGGSGDVDSWLVKFDRDSKILWQKKFGGSGLQLAGFIIKAHQSGYVFLGRENGDTHGGLAVKVDEDGKEVWKCIYGKTYLDGYADMIATSDGGYAIVGRTPVTDRTYLFKWYLRWLVY